jgi:predicted small lipoprotein YifL
MRNVRLLVAVAVAGTLLSCGLKGPLVLPDAQHPHKKIGVGKPPAAPAPAAPSRGAPSPGTPPPAAPPPAASDPAPQP